jgi:hypothetical protein
MILEGLVTTLAPDGAVHLAPMGPRLHPERPGFGDPAWRLERFTLRPFRTAQTYRNLTAHPQGVLHVTDDVLLLARAAVGPVEPLPALLPAARVRGSILQDACRYYEFRIVSCDDSSERVQMEAEVVAAGRLRDFFGLNRAKYAVVEAAILATRVSLLPLDDIEAEFRKLRVLVEKTGGQQEHEAFAFLERFLAEEKARRANLPSA